MDGQIVISSAVLLSIIIYFLRDFFLSIKELKSKSDTNDVRLSIVENNQHHQDDKFEKLYDAVKELTKELKYLNSAFQKKKDT